MNKKAGPKSFLSFSVLGRIVVAGLLVYALRRHPYSYYTILRWATSGVSAFNAYIAHQNEAKFWLGFFIAIAVLFNPIVPIYMARQTWATVDIITAVIMLVSIFFVRELKEN